MSDKTCLSYWFPLIQAAGLPVPRTIIVRAAFDLSPLLDRKLPTLWQSFLADLEAAVNEIGCPCFLRTGMTSCKHQWRHTCYLDQQSNLADHVFNLVEFSACCDFIGLPTDVWCVRELLPTIPQFTAFKGMPICREFRFFVADGTVKCHHPYWPKDSLEQGFPPRSSPVDDDDARQLPDHWQERYDALCWLSDDDKSELCRLASAAGQAVGGEWSVDIIETERGWYVTDMAEAARSFHWPGCERSKPC